MLSEFFCNANWRTRAFSFVGVVVITAHSFWRAFVKYRLNQWYGKFYDLGGAASEVSSGDVYRLEDGRSGVNQLLVEFVTIVGPGILIHPLFKLATNRWVLAWRLSLIDGYLQSWRLDNKKLENGAQRVHEDTQRFARGIETCVIVVLDAVLTLCTFSPLLVKMGAEVQPRDLPDHWLLALSGTVAGGGALVSVFCGWSLVQLEVENQKVEAELRKKLVLLEEDPGTVCGGARELDAAEDDADKHATDPNASDATQKSPVPEFKAVLFNLRANYSQLYNQFAIFSLWLGSFEQAVAILPYAITAPLLFCDDPSRRLTLGKVTQLANAFGNVFASLNVLTENWTSVTDWLSVLRRLREWERHLHAGPNSATRTLIDPSSEASIEMVTPAHKCATEWD